MLDFLLESDFSGPAAAALWGTVATALATLLLLLYTIELRVRRVLGEQRRRRIVEKWRGIIAAAVASGEPIDARALPKLPWTERKEFLRLWNQTRNMLEGAAAERLIALAERLGLERYVQRHVEHANLATRLMAIQALGHLRSERGWDLLLEACDDRNTLVSITAAEALAEIDAVRAAMSLIPKIAVRRDWPKTHVFRLLQNCGSDAISEPLFRAIRTAPDADAAYLLQFATLAEFDVRDAVVQELLASRDDPNVLASALKIFGGYGRIPRIESLTRHREWYVRMQAARALGRMGRSEQHVLLERLLSDSEWWVRYRAAQAMSRLPGFDTAKLRAVQNRQTDPFARDILEQVLAERQAR